MGQCLPLCIRNLIPSIRANTAQTAALLEPGTGQGTALGIPCHGNGSAPASLKMGAGKWRKPLDHENTCSGNSLRNVPVLEQKKASFVGTIPWKAGAGKVLGLGWHHSSQPVFNAQDCASPSSCLCSLTSLLSSACQPCPNNPPVSMDMSSRSLGNGWRLREHLHSQSSFSPCHSKCHQK